MAKALGVTVDFFVGPNQKLTFEDAVADEENVRVIFRGYERLSEDRKRQLKDYQIDAELLTNTPRDFRAVYNELTPDQQTRLLQLVVQEVVLGKDTPKISVFPLGDSGKPLEYLLKHPEFAESDNKRGLRDESINWIVMKPAA